MRNSANVNDGHLKREHPLKLSTAAEQSLRTMSHEPSERVRLPLTCYWFFDAGEAASSEVISSAVYALLR